MLLFYKFRGGKHLNANQIELFLVLRAENKNKSTHFPQKPTHLKIILNFIFNVCNMTVP